MIKRYEIRAHSEPKSRFVWHWGYLFYSMLLAETGPEFSQYVHNEGLSPFVQNIQPSKEAPEAVWTVTLMGEEAIREVSPILDTITQLYMEDHQLPILLGERKTVILPDTKTLMNTAQESLRGREFTLQFTTPTSFKSDGAYQIFPSEALIIKSLANKWNAYTDDVVIDDEDALRAMIQGVKIKDYRLQSKRFQIKGAVIPGFVGEVTLLAKLPQPLLEIFKLLIYYSGFCGIGVKSSLGMGSVKVKEHVVRT